MKILIVGSKGQLGRELFRLLNERKCVIGDLPREYMGADVVQADIDILDITDLDRVVSYIECIKPEVIINCAAYTNVDGCERNADDAFYVNAIGPRNLAIAAEKTGSKLLHLSTDYVFSGDEKSERNEYDRPNPSSIYGKTKLIGEDYVRQFSSKWFIIRTSWLYGHHGKNFVKSIIRKAREDGSVMVVGDQFGNPTNVEDLAYHVLKIALTEQYGIYHCTGKGTCSWYEFACAIVKNAGIAARVDQCTTEAYPSHTKRPAYSALGHTMLRLTVRDEMRDWQQALSDFIVKELKMECIDETN